MEPAGPVVLPLAVGDGAGIAAVAAFVALVISLAAVGPALYFTWHAFNPVEKEREDPPQDIEAQHLPNLYDAACYSEF